MKNNWICNLVEVVIEGPEVNILEKIKITRNKNEKVVKVVKKMKKVGVKVLQEEEQQIEGDLVLKEEKVYVPKKEVLRVEIIWLHHDILVAEHGEKWKIMELVTKNYWWPGVMSDVGKYVEDYDIYHRMKNKMEVSVGKLKLSKVSEKP